MFYALTGVLFLITSIKDYPERMLIKAEPEVETEWELEDKTLEWIESLNEIKCNSVRGKMWSFRKRSQVGTEAKHFKEVMEELERVSSRMQTHWKFD